MPASRASALELSRLLDAVDQPVYALNDQRRVVYCNRAFREWTGGSDELIGQECRYHGNPEATGPASLAAAICPPPEAFMRAGGTVRAVVVACADPDGPPRMVDFVPLAAGDGNVAGVIAFVGSPPADCEADPLERRVTARLHERLQRYRRQQGARYQLGRLIGDSPAMKRVRCQVELAAAGKASVLIVGPPGIGRQHVARTIHYAQAGESSGPLVPLACPLLGAELLQATIRTLARPRPQESASKLATLLLNDVDGLPADAQAELAGFMTLADLPVRIVSTARKELLPLADRELFRRDLACLLSTVVIDIPPLAQRREDIPLLAQWFVEQANSRGSKQLAGLSQEALDRLDMYPWPGGVAELEAHMEQAHARAEGLEIVPRDLSERIELAEQAAARPSKEQEVIVLEDFLGQIERELIERALRLAKGNKTKAARLLGLTRPRLYRRLVQLGFEK